MNMEFVQENCLLSSISNISVKIDYNQREDLGFFHNSVHQNQILYQNQKNPLINLIPHRYPSDHQSLFEKILAKVSTETNASIEQNNFWVFDDEQLVASEQIQPPFKISQPKIQLINKTKNKKRKSSKKKILKKSTKPQSDELKRNLIQLQIRQRNETKNIPKNYGKAIIGFASKNLNQIKHLTEFDSNSSDEFKKELKEVKKSICTIADLRKLWVDFKHAKVMRIAGDLFLRRHALTWIFNSKISNINAHVKYRNKLLEAIKEPNAFQYMKNA